MKVDEIYYFPPSLGTFERGMIHLTVLLGLALLFAFVLFQPRGSPCPQSACFHLGTKGKAFKCLSFCIALLKIRFLVEVAGLFPVEQVLVGGKEMPL